MKLISVIVGGIEKSIEPEGEIVGKGIDVPEVDISGAEGSTVPEAPDRPTVVPKRLESVGKFVGRVIAPVEEPVEEPV